jgi:hypothetical protein
MKAKEDYLNQVQSDQMILKIVRQGPKATQGEPSDSSPLRSDGFCDGQAGRLDCCGAVAKDTQN